MDAVVRSRWIVGLVLLLVAVAIGVSTYLRRADSPVEVEHRSTALASRELVELPSGRYAGSRACQECHAGLCDVYRTTHGMARSLASTSQATSIEDWEQATFQTPDMRRYRVERDGEQVVHHELMQDREQNVLYDEGVPVSYAIGSGGRGRGYLIDRDGRLYQSPISWYSQRQAWALSPGYQPGTHSRFQFRITEDCLYCHAGRLAAFGAGSNRFADPPFLEESISCERCHGPAGEHVERQRAGLPDNSLVKIGELPAARRDAVCWQCHLRASQSIPLTGQNLFDFRPGQLLHENRLVVLEQTESAEAGGLSTVAQLLTSRCYQESDGALGCISCHDPHERTAVEQRPAHYQERCNQCHQDRGCSLPEQERLVASASGSCIECHMPSNATASIPHTAITDHRILRRYLEPPANTSPDAAPVASAEVAFFGVSEAEVPPAEWHRARGLALATRGIGSGDQALIRAAIRELDPLGAAHGSDDERLLEHLAICYMIIESPQQGLACWTRLLEIAPDNETALRSMAILSASRNDGPGMLAYAERLQAANPDLPEPYFMQARALEMLQRAPEAIAAAEESLRRDPTALPVRMWLIAICDATGQTEKAAAQRKWVEAYLNALGAPLPN